MATIEYGASAEALIVRPWNITFLSERDVQLRTPINFVSTSGVALTPACFANRRYEDFSAAQCLSNLLATGFRRIHVDIYWDAGRSVWSLCPVALPSYELPAGEVVVGEVEDDMVTTISTVTPTETASAGVTQRAEYENGRRAAQVSEQGSPLSETQVTVSIHETEIVKTTATVSIETAGTRIEATIPEVTAGAYQELLYDVEPYICSNSTASDIMVNVLRTYLEATDNTLDATVQYIVFNVHAASSFLSPLSPAPAPEFTLLPNSEQLFGVFFSRNTSSFLYTPSVLADSRLDPQDEWDANGNLLLQTDQSYFTNITTGDGDDDYITSDGWPSGGILEFEGDNHLRLLLSYGTIDPQMQDYNITGDLDVFRPNVIENLVPVSITDDELTEGCIYNPSTTSISSANSSWAFAVVPESALLDISTSANLTARLPVISNITYCGLSPFLNSTLGDSNSSAGTNVFPYRHFAYSAIWSWAWDQPPVFNSSNVTDLSVPGNALRCAVLDPSIPGGRWRAAQCDSSYRGACQAISQPLSWQVTSSSADYGNISLSCPPNTTFSTPQTNLESRYLLDAYLSATQPSNPSSPNQDSTTIDPLWINLNSLDIPGCWVVGENSTCPYNEEVDNSAQIYVPTVAGLIILIMTGVLVVVKCGANRVKSKRTRKGENGWDYEGVPA